jgi:hypothetical protein
MSTTQKLLIPVALLVAVSVLSLSVWNYFIRDHQLRQSIEDRCWAQGGEYRDYTCRKPEDKRTDQEKVCMAMKASYIIDGPEFKCYSAEGKELKMPDLKGKEVIEMHDGTVLLRAKRK